MKELIHFVENHPKIFDISGKKSGELVEKAETALGVRLPKSYKDYLQNFGTLSFGARTYFGVIKEDFENSRHPDVVWYNLLMRRDFEFPEHLLIVYNDEGVVFTCLDTSNFYSEYECALVMWDNVHKEVFESVNVSFVDYLLEEIEEQIDELIEENES
jgi:hypothetical protein